MCIIILFIIDRGVTEERVCEEIKEICVPVSCQRTFQGIAWYGFCSYWCTKDRVISYDEYIDSILP